MTYEEFLKWIDEQIEYNDRMARKEDRKMEPYFAYQGAHDALEAVKEKFLTLLPPPTKLS